MKTTHLQTNARRHQSISTTCSHLPGSNKEVGLPMNAAIHQPSRQDDEEEEVRHHSKRTLQGKENTMMTPPRRPAAPESVAIIHPIWSWAWLSPDLFQSSNPSVALRTPTAAGVASHPERDRAIALCIRPCRDATVGRCGHYRCWAPP
jgi:hypothetical protein